MVLLDGDVTSDMILSEVHLYMLYIDSKIYPKFVLLVKIYIGLCA